MSRLEILQTFVGPCREWIPDKHDRCNAPSEYVLWGKLIDPEGLGPRCYDHAARHVPHAYLYSQSGAALINLKELAQELEES